MRNILMLTLLSFLFLSCEAQKEIAADILPAVPEADVSDPGELGGKWEVSFLSPYVGADINHYKIQKPYLTFVSKIEVAGNNGCNNIAGLYETENNTIKFHTDEFRSTRMYCQNVNEEAFPKALKMVNRYEIINSRTLMLSAGDAVVITLTKVEDAAAEDE